MRWSRPRGKTKVKESIRIKPTDQRTECPSDKPVDTMNFPKFIVFKAIAFSIVLFLLFGHSRAAAAVRYKKCTMDYECNQGEFCLQKPGASYCAPCLDCNRYNREPSRRCARLRTDCGPCLPGFGELGPHCSRLVKETVMSYATDQTLKHDQGAKSDQPKDFSRWLVMPVASVVVVIVVAVGAVVPRGKCAAGGGEPDEINNNENSVDLEQFAAGDHIDDDPIVIYENQQENLHAMDGNDDHHLHVDNDNGHQVDIDENQVPNALQDFWQDIQIPGAFFEMEDQVVPQDPEDPELFFEMEDQVVPQDPGDPELFFEMEDQVVPDMAQMNNLALQQGLQIFGGDLVQIFDDDMDNFPGCG